MAGRFKFVAIGVIAFGLLLGVAFGLGVKYGKGKQTTTTGGLTAQQVLSLVGGTGGGGAATAGGGGAAGGAGGTGGAGGAGANPALAALTNLTSGKITAVQGQIITVDTRSGPVKVNVGVTASVNKSVQGAPQDLKEGTTVTISGTKGPDGSVNATSVSILPADLATVLGSVGGTGGAPATGGTTPQAPAATRTP